MHGAGLRPLSAVTGKLVGEHVDVLYVRFRAEQLCSLSGKCLPDSPREVGLAGLVIWENVEYSESRFVELEGEPSACTRFLFNDRARGAEEIRDVLLLAGLGFQYHRQCNLNHAPSPGPI